MIAGRSGLSAMATMPLRRKRSAPQCSASTSRSRVSATAGMGSSRTKAKHAIRSSWRVGAWGGGGGGLVPPPHPPPPPGGGGGGGGGSAPPPYPSPACGGGKGGGGGIPDTRVEQPRRFDVAERGRQHWRGRIERRKPIHQRTRRLRHEIGLGQHQTIGDRDLFDRF